MSRPLLVRPPARRVLAAGLATSLLLSGCAVGPEWNGTPGLAVPAAWTGSSAKAAPIDGAALGDWWKDFRDPLLDRLMEDAVAGNLDVAAAAAKIREARASRREAIGGLLPSVDGSASGTRAQSAASAQSPKTSVSNLFQAGFDASWEIDLFGANARTLEAASHGVAASEADLRSTLLTLVGDVASYYVEARGYQARIALARRTAASQRQTAALTRTKFEAGTATAIDTSKADATAATTEANIPTYETAYAEAVHRLSVLTGQAPGALSAEMARVRPIPGPHRALPTGIPADVLRNRPDVRAAESRLAQSTAQVGVAEAALYPSVSLAGSIATSATRPGDLGRGSTISWSWGPSVSVPFFEGGKLVAARDGAEATRDQSFVAWKASVLTALEDVENALVALRQERIRSAKLAESAEAYRTAADLSRKLYANGSASFLDVLDAERSLYTAEDSLIQSRISVSTDSVALAKALGGGWRKPVDTSKPEIVDEKTGPRPAKFDAPAP